MNDYVVEILYQDKNDVTQQELFEISAKKPEYARDYVIKLLTSEGAKITYIKVDGYNVQGGGSMNEYLDELEYQHDDDWMATLDYLDSYNDDVNSDKYDEN